MKSKLLVALSLSLFVIACSSPKEQEKSSQKNAWKPEMDQPSELATIMRTLHDEAKNRKRVLEQNEMATSFENELIFDLITASPTEPHMVGPAFEPHAQAFIASYGQLNTATSAAEQIEAHNNLVKSCVACHMSFCQGPIPRIEKLYVAL